MPHSYPINQRLLAVAACLAMLVAALGGAVAAAPAANAQTSPTPVDTCLTGRPIPVSQISIQLFSLRAEIGRVGIEPVLAELARIGYTNVEPYSYHGLNATAFKALLDKYNLKMPTRHGSTNETNWGTQLADGKLFGQQYLGSGGFASPGIGSYANVLATAATLNRLGERSVANGTGKIFGHNHDSEFTTMYIDANGDGTLKSAWQIMVENTDPRYVAFQLDVLWAQDGGANIVDLLNRFGDRIELLHIKDGININPAPGRQATPVNVGRGEMNFAPIFEAARGKVRFYTVENDNPTNWQQFSQESFDYVHCYYGRSVTQLNQIVAANGITEGLASKVRHAIAQAQAWLDIPGKEGVALSHLRRAISLLLWQADLVDSGKTNQGNAASLRALAATLQAVHDAHDD